MGYHKRTIQRSPFGTAGKIGEETEEFLDAVEQDNAVMALSELSDLVGAIRGYLAVRHPSVCLSDLIVMADATARAFESGRRNAAN